MVDLFRNFIALLGGVAIGVLVNGGIIALQPFILPLPQGVDPNDMASLTVAMTDFSWHNFIMPFWPTHWVPLPGLILPYASRAKDSYLRPWQSRGSSC